MSVDGTDFRIAMDYDKSYYSYKFKKMALRYEVGVCIRTGDIVWWSGPYEPGVWNDLMIFNDCLAKQLEPDEVVEADMGYRGGALTNVNCPPYEVPSRRSMTATARLRHETCNKRFKQWNALNVPFRHGIYAHQSIFAAISCITQLAFESGEPLFPVDYNDAVGV